MRMGIRANEIEIGNVELDNNLILAPMAGVTDMSVPRSCAGSRAVDFLYTEMVSAKAILYKNQ